MQTKIDYLSQQIYSRYGEIKRARGPFLYTAKGVRLTDLYLDNGRSLLGWEGGKARLAFKNAVERGQTGNFVTHNFHALEKGVLELFPGFDFVRVCHEIEVEKKLPRWFPWLSDISKEQIFYFVPPFPFACDYVIVIGKEKNNCVEQSTCCELACSEEFSDLFDSSQTIVNPSLLAAFTRSIYDLKSALQTRTEDDFRFFDKSLEKYFTRTGPYLFVRPEIFGCAENESSAEQNLSDSADGEISIKKYKKFVEFCLDCGVVISPDPKIPSVIPFGADYGVLRKLAREDF